jgi:tetratricopeptide (TPR) repeat protein
MKLAWLLAAGASLLAAGPGLHSARDRQDKAALEAAAAQLAAAAQKNPADAAGQYRLAEAQSLLAEVAQELGDKALAARAAEAGIRAAERAVALQGGVAEYHRMLGNLCGQAIPANLLLAARYGRCALESVKRAIELDPKLATAYLSRGVGNYYLPDAFGGGVEFAVRDLQRAIELDPKLADAHLWLGIALRKQQKFKDARAAIQRSLELNPARVWARQQLAKTPAP